MSRSMVKASVMRPRVVLAVSNLDLLSQDIPVWLLCVYRRPSASSGDFNIDPRSGLPELHCDNQGADVIVGEVSEALGSLHYGDLAASLARIGIPVQFGADVALSVQLVSFACGGFAVAWGSNHLLLDGCALYMIANAWPELAGCSGTTISAAPPNHDRSVFRPRAPPAYSSSTGELFGLAGGPKTTRLEAVSAYMWKVFTTVVGSSDEKCRMAWFVNGRRHLTSTAPAEAMRSYVGNVVSYAVAEESVEGIKRQPLQGIASMMRESIKSTDTDEHFQQLLDWVEDHKGKHGATARYIEAATVGLGSPLLGLTSLTSFHLDTDFGFGQAAFAMPMWVGSGRLCSGKVTVTTSPPVAPASSLACLFG
ncbi:hypothetical protein ACQ4PT_008816 [Festuca glaucescens]